MAALVDIGGNGFLQKSNANNGQESQPSPLALLAATCSRIESPNENAQQQQQQVSSEQQIDLSTAQITQTANGWQIIPAASSVSGSGAATITTVSQSGGDAGKTRQVMTGGQQYVLSSAPGIQGQQVLASLTSVMPNIQYQVIPQFQTVDGQQLQFASPAQGINVQQDASGQFQLVSQGGGQQIIATGRGGGSAAGQNIITMPGGLLQQAVPLQNLGIGSNLLQSPAQFLANMPMALNGNITLVPVASAGSGQTVAETTVHQQQQQPTSSSGGVYFTSSGSLGTTTQASNSLASFTTVASAQQSTPQRSGSGGTGFQNAGTAGTVHIQPCPQDNRDSQSQQQQQQQQILIQPQLIQGGLQTIPAGQAFATQTISQDALQGLQIQTLPNTGPILLRTVGPNGQVSWQTLQMPNTAGTQTITLAPMQALGQSSGGTVTLNASQLSGMQGLQTINLNTLGNAGIQMHQLQGVPITIANTAVLAHQLSLQDLPQTEKVQATTSPTSLTSPRLDLTNMELHQVINRGRYAELWKGSLEGVPVVFKLYPSGGCRCYDNESAVYGLALLRHPSIALFLGEGESGQSGERVLVLELAQHVINRGRYAELWKGSLEGVPVVFKLYPSGGCRCYDNESAVYGLALLRHPSIACFLGEGESGQSGERVLVLELAQHGSLRVFLSQHCSDWAGTVRLALSLCQGLSFLHSEIHRDGVYKPAVAHRDLSSNNVLVKADRTCVLSDFGSATALNLRPGPIPLRTQEVCVQVGTPRYMPPEILDGTLNIRDPLSSLRQVDVYSLGLLVWEMTTRCTDLWTVSPVPEYRPAYEAELGPSPSLDELVLLVSERRKRPVLTHLCRGTTLASPPPSPVPLVIPSKGLLSEQSEV
ncbi:UNVERIFIED_CONTAM: hypothetical protein FKN15_010812 [Acipenser sinensis]